MLKGHCQPQDHDFPKRQFGVTIRRFNLSWFKEFGSWLEYSVGKDAAYCLYCYLFRTSSGKQGGEQARNAYVTRLNASIDCVRVLLRQGHSFRGHDESEDSSNSGNFLVQLQFLAAHNEVINAVTLGNAPHNCKLTSPDVQKDIVNACAIETINVIIKDVGDSLFSILVDESYVVSMKVAKKNIPITNFFRVVGNVINTVGVSSKRYVLAMIVEDKSCSCNQRSDATNLLELIQRFDFAFNLQLMRSVLGMSNELSKALQRKNQNIVNAMQLIHVPNMDDMFVRLAIRGRPQQVNTELLLCVACLCPQDSFSSFNKKSLIRLAELYPLDFSAVDGISVIDLQLQELNDRFSEVNTELLLCVVCLCPQDSFSSFNKKSLIRLAELYPLDFSVVDGIVLGDQLETYIFDIRSNKEFEGLNGLGDLAEKLVLTKKDKVYPLVYRLLTLTLILPVATATVERVFSAMNIVKNRLRNRMGDQWMNDSTI
ncbi:uncharacterized protein LOC111377158, partial [Olea europaea var. sylvestris]|uniref:uncharacterized protein LOC111377158 n=1 Tax=Olea europaea var. sylvestris TaxID=158386 RepID=UPI000C1D48B9